ncbi:MAG: hypothetical protein ABEI99_05205, partial [Halobaculum sp.]
MVSSRELIVVFPGIGVVGGITVGVLVPFLPLLVTAVGGLGAGAAVGVSAVVLVDDEDTDDTGPTYQRSDTTTGATTLDVSVVDGVTGDPVQEPVTLTAEQSVTNDRRELTIEDGTGSIEVEPMQWELVATLGEYTGRTTVDASARERAVVELPPTRVAVSVDGVDPARVSAENETVHWTDDDEFVAGDPDLVFECPYDTDRLTLSTEKTAVDVVCEGRTTETTVSFTGTEADTEIPETGIPEVDRHAPTHSPAPPRLDIPTDRLADCDPVAETSQSRVCRLEIGDRTVAVKRPAPNGDGRPVIEAVAENAEAWRRVDGHPNVARLMDADPADPYLAVEWVDLTVADLPEPVELPAALWTASRIADAVEAMHEANVVHLNLKPRNVLLQDVGDRQWPVPKLTDPDTPRLLDRPSD